MKNIKHQLGAILTRLFLAAALAVPGVIALGVNQTAHAAAAVFYSPDASDNCAPAGGQEGVHLTKGFQPTSDSVIYFCALMPSGSVTFNPVGSAACPSGQPQWNNPQFGNLCITAFPGGVWYGDAPDTASASGDTKAKNTDTSGKFNANCDVETPELKAACASDQPILKLIEIVANWIIRLLIPLAILFIIISGIQYITSQGNPDAIKKAKQRIVGAITGLILLGLMFAILNFIIPGQ